MRERERSGESRLSLSPVFLLFFWVPLGCRRRRCPRSRLERSRKAFLSASSSLPLLVALHLAQHHRCHQRKTPEKEREIKLNLLRNVKLHSTTLVLFYNHFLSLPSAPHSFSVLQSTSPTAFDSMRYADVVISCSLPLPQILPSS